MACTIAAEYLRPAREASADGNMWPTYFALKELTSAEEKKIAGLVKKAAS